MTDFQAVILGIVQGVTEFLPISSNAHLKIVPVFLGWQDPGAAFVAVCQWGTLLATLIYFRNDILQILLAKRSASPDADERQIGIHLLIPIIVGTIPVVVFGLLLRKQIEREFRSLYIMAGCMIFFALLLWLAEAQHRARKSLSEVSVADGLFVGVGQAFALIPGASRSGTTITAALFTGLERAAAARFSFLLSLPAIFAAGLFELWTKRHDIATSGMTRPLVIATVVSFVVGWASIDWLMKFLKHHPTHVFIAYRLLVGLALLALLLSGRIQDTTGPNIVSVLAPVTSQ